MRIKLIATILCLFLIPCLVSPPVVFAAVGINVNQGIVGTEVTFSGLTADQSYTIKWDGSINKSGTVSSMGTATFIIPESKSGSHNIDVESPSGTSVYSVVFTVLPSISIDPTSGIVGTTITVKGTGFQASEEKIAITFDGTTMKSAIVANSSGSWETTITLPATKAGDRIVDASGNNTSADAVANKTFTVYPNIAVKPGFGSVGTEVTVSGTGFDSSETGINITYDGTQIKSNITATTNGSWSSSFSIPQSTKGDHTIDASGSNTSSSAVPDITFSVSSGIVVEPITVQVGDDVNISGSGFANKEENIKLFFDGAVIKSDIVADSNGYWTISLSIPESVNGPHEFDASGNTTTTSEVKNATVTLEARIVLNPTTGNIGEDIAITGTGFSKSSGVDIDYGGKHLPVSITTDAKGNFNTRIVPLEGMSGQIKVQAKDAKGVAVSAAFIIETTPPEAPRIASPKDGARIGFIGDTKVTFDWTDVTDPSGVYYALQISDKLDFSNLILDIPKLPTSEYALSEAESLAPGDYFWRIKAIDKAGNSSEWVGPFVIRTAFIDIKTTAIIIGSFIAFIIVITVIPRVIIRAVRKKSNWSKDKS